ncbi:MAG: type I DNA topoisomerase [bacterium]
MDERNSVPSKSLMIVESPAKAKTIEKFLGKGFQVKACMGHIKDLPERELGINVNNGYEPKYVTVRGKAKVLKQLREAARSAGRIYLATDPDREGEAIAWHVAQAISPGIDGDCRVLFNEITERAVKQAVTNPSAIDVRKVNAQQARRIMDRLVGYQVSPLLWKTVAKGLSAGRVQSVALRMVCEREGQIASFVPEEYWSITAEVKSVRSEPFKAKLVSIGSEKVKIPDEKQAQEIVDDVRERPFVVDDIKRKKVKKSSQPPFITSTLQQEAGRKLHFSPQKTMALAQQLYEGLEIGAEGSVGLITYMRTDSTRVAKEALEAVRQYIYDNYGLDYLPEKPNLFKSKRGAQEAHEAIRPTSMSRPPKELKRFLTEDLFKLYELIWIRFVASQMKPAIYDVTTVDVKADHYLFRASGSVVTFRGFTTVYEESTDENQREEGGRIPSPLNVGEELVLLDLTAEQHFTKPPPRYSEASLVKELEAKGVGRPSTYAQIVTTLKTRNYVTVDKRRLQATDLGLTVNRILVRNFPDLFDVAFTAKMEEGLDRIEAGEDRWIDVVDDFYVPFNHALQQAHEKRGELKESTIEWTEVPCEKCGRRMVIKWGKNGRFMACSGFPECRNTRPIEGREQARQTDEVCEKCGSKMVIRSGRFGRFLACSAYPKCEHTRPLSVGVSCPEHGCTGFLTERRTKKGKTFYGCSRYPECTFALWDRPLAQRCSLCDGPFLVVKKTKERGEFLRCPKCKGEFELESGS